MGTCVWSSQGIFSKPRGNARKETCEKNRIEKQVCEKQDRPVALSERLWMLCFFGRSFQGCSPCCLQPAPLSGRPGQAASAAAGCLQVQQHYSLRVINSYRGAVQGHEPMVQLTGTVCSIASQASRHSYSELYMAGKLCGVP